MTLNDFNSKLIKITTYIITTCDPLYDNIWDARYNENTPIWLFYVEKVALEVVLAPLYIFCEVIDSYFSIYNSVIKLRKGDRKTND